MPTARPAVLRVQASDPVPVPLVVVSVVQLFFLLTVHAVVAALVPASVTVALSPGAALPCGTDALRPAGETDTTTGIVPEPPVGACASPHPVRLSKPGAPISIAPALIAV